MLEKIDCMVRQVDSWVVDVSVSLVGSWKIVLVLVIDGMLSVDIWLLVCLSLFVILQQDGCWECGGSGGGGCRSYELFDDVMLKQYVDDVIKMVQVNLEVREVLVGIMLVVFGLGWLGVLLYEVVGYGLEGDFNCRGMLNYSGWIGLQVVFLLCLIVDDGMLLDLCGLFIIDDEGILMCIIMLVEKGILKGYLQDKFNVCLMGVEFIGNGCREFYVYLFMLCMINIYLLVG